jgi:DNA-3-methyladenine glycosylase I
MKNNSKVRCFGNKPGQELYAEYHDKEWGAPEHDDQKLFELLILEGCQAGLSWELILKRREGYRRAFYGFDPKKVAAMTDEELEAQCQNPEIIRNRLKVFAARQNARVFLKIQEEYRTFGDYIWRFVDGKPIENHRDNLKEVPCFSPVSDAISRELKRWGMTFVGTKIIYSFMQASGMVNDHLKSCWLLQKT